MHSIVLYLQNNFCCNVFFVCPSCIGQFEMVLESVMIARDRWLKPVSSLVHIGDKNTHMHIMSAFTYV